MNGCWSKTMHGHARLWSTIDCRLCLADYFATGLCVGQYARIRENYVQLRIARIVLNSIFGLRPCVITHDTNPVWKTSHA